ncbi:hypothetical protein CRE_30499 [Caenorhabditis remanei]|uniref:F-box domain-containing protein n=1 Tax=Caenorhabditis remanei TaxID=31234 RepID=E3NI73_CAERE|nr:hypothetical protein CRE_30499 [Caenorhabditis remanei]
MDSPKPFPILRLPFLAIGEAFKAMHPFEIINFSMISKRTKGIAKQISVCPRYKIDFHIKETLEIWFFGTRNMAAYVMTSDKEMDGKIEEKECCGSILPVPLIFRKVFKYSKDPVDEWKQLCKYVLEIFKKHTINDLLMTMDAFVDHNVSIIDFLKANLKSVDRCTVSQWNRERYINVDEYTAYLLDNIQINSDLCTDVYIKNINFNGKFPKNLEDLHIKNSEWIGYERLALVLHDIPHEVVDEAVKRTFKTRRNCIRELNGGIDIRRHDGKTATLFVFGIGLHGSFLMCVH